MISCSHFRVMHLTAYGMVVIYFLIFTSGVIAYSAFAGCDPSAQGILKKKDEIMPYFVTNRLNFVTGLPGIFVATIIGGALRFVLFFSEIFVADVIAGGFFSFFTWQPS